MASFRGEMIAENGDEICGERDGIAIFEQERESLGELDDQARSELARELDFDKTCVGTLQRLRGAGIGNGHGRESNRPQESR